jgi:hypothetical protein
LLTLIRPATRLALFAFTLACGPLAHGESLVSGSLEGVAFVGGTAGHGTLGAGLAKALTPRWLLIGELAYVHSNAVEFGVNGHYLFPTRNPDLTPYLLVGMGVLSSGFGRGRDRDTAFGANIGGGLRWRTGTNWGIRPEIKGLIGDGSYGRFTVGLYYNFGR